MSAREELLKLAGVLKLQAMKEKLAKEASVESKNRNVLDSNNNDELTLKQAMAIVDDLVEHGKIKSTERDKMLRKLASAKKSDVDALCRLLDIDLLPESNTKEASLSDVNGLQNYDDDILEFFEKYGYPDSLPDG